MVTAAQNILSNEDYLVRNGALTPKIRRVAVPSQIVAVSKIDCPLRKKLIDKGASKSPGSGVPKRKDVEQQMRREHRELLRNQRLAFGGSKQTKHREKDRDVRWARLRVHQVRRVTSMFVRGDDEERLGLINEHEARVVDELCKRAAFAAAAMSDSRKLETANPGLWAIILVQQVWCNSNPGGWVVNDKCGMVNLSFPTMESICAAAQGESSRMPEIHQNDNKEVGKSKKDREVGIVRRLCAHNNGCQSACLLKIDCLDALLQASNLEGQPSCSLHGDIKRMLPPALMRMHKPISASLSNAKLSALNTHPKFGNTAISP